jgi:hypothetical protein
MTVLSISGATDTKRAGPDEYWHSAVMHGGVISNVVVGCDADGTWTARTQLCDRSLRPIGDRCDSAAFATHDEALDAGQAVALRLHKALIGTHPVLEKPRTIALLEPIGGYQSQALQRLARAQQSAQTMRLPMVVAQRVSEAEMIA